MTFAKDWAQDWSRDWASNFDGDALQKLLTAPTPTNEGAWVDNRATSDVLLDDHEGVPRAIPAGELPWEGGRVAKNLFIESEDLTTFLSKNNVTVTANTLTSTAAAYAYARKLLTVVPGNDYVVSYDVSSDDQGTIDMRAYDQSNLSDIVSQSFTSVTGTVKRISYTFTAPAGCTQVYIYAAWNADAIGEVVTFDRWQLEDATGRTDTTTPSEYLAVGTGDGADILPAADQNFDANWALAGGATESGGSIIFDAPGQTASYDLIGSLDTSAGDYIIAVEISGYVAGGVNIRYGDWAYTSAGVDGNGTFFLLYTAAGVATFELQSAGAGATFQVDSITVQRATDGYTVFDTANGNSVASNVVTEATGAALSPPPNLRHVPATTNYADGADDLSGGAETVDLTTPGTGDYTLSVQGTAAVTVAAGTATGTGFGQATEGSPVTFNLSAAGTITLTLDSGTLDKIDGLALKQVEPGSFATPIVLTNGASATRNAADVSQPLTLGSNFKQSEGTIIIKFVAENAAGSGDAGAIFSIADSATNVLYHESGALKSTDGTNTATVSTTWAAGDEIEAAVRYNTTDDLLEVGYSVNGGVATWGTSTSYDGAFASGTDINLCYANAELIQIIDLDTYGSTVTQEDALP